MSIETPSSPSEHGDEANDPLVSYSEHPHPNIEVGIANAPLLPPAGGDFSAVAPLPDGTVGVVMGDVAGHGPEAAAHAERIRDAVLGVMAEGLPPDEALGFVNAAAEASEEFDGFATAFAARIEPQTGEIIYANGGHEPALIASPTEPNTPASEATITELTTTGPPLGALAGDEARYALATAHLPPGGTLLTYTDGVSEARRTRNGEFFSFGRVRALLAQFAHFSPLRLCRLLIGRARAFAGRGRQLRDDAAVLTLRRRR